MKGKKEIRREKGRKRVYCIPTEPDFSSLLSNRKKMEYQWSGFLCDRTGFPTAGKQSRETARIVCRSRPKRAASGRELVV
ncbi:MAG: hypothetical protein ACFNYI_08010, partial [Eubacterium sp.]